MTPVKDQGYCGSCWAFNSSSVLEAKISIMQTSNNGGSLVPPVRLSEQEAVDCSTEYGNLGCDGGWPSNYWFYVYYEGAVSHDDYKYEGVDQNCKRDSSMDRIAEVWDWNDVGQNDQTIANALQEGPLSIAVMVEGDAWDYYSGGVFPVDDCTTPSVNHAMVLVGYESGEGSGSEDIWVPPTEDIWVAPTDPIWVPGGDEFVPASLDYCRRSRSEERDAGKCAGNLSSFNFDLTMCCKLGDEEQTISGGDGYWIPGEDGYMIPGEEGYWIPGEGSSGSGEAVWIFQNSWGSDWGENGNVRIPVEVGDGPGHCQVQAFVEDVIAM